MRFFRYICEYLRTTRFSETVEMNWRFLGIAFEWKRWSCFHCITRLKNKPFRRSESKHFMFIYSYNTGSYFTSNSTIIILVVIITTSRYWEDWVDVVCTRLHVLIFLLLHDCICLFGPPSLLSICWVIFLFPPSSVSLF